MKKYLIGLVSLIFAMSVFAKDEKSGGFEQLIKSLTTHFPDAHKDDIHPTPIKGILEFTHGPTVIYVTEDGRYLFSGDIIDTADQYKNITEKSRRQARVNAIKDLKPSQTIDFVPEQAKHTVTVFTDVDCTYCRKFHAHVAELNKRGIGVKYLAFPRGGPGSKGFDKTVSVWCAKDPKEAITLAKQGKDITQSVCENHSVDLEFQMGIMMGVTGTPSIVLENGVIIPGYLTPDKLEEVLAKMDQM